MKRVIHLVLIAMFSLAGIALVTTAAPVEASAQAKKKKKAKKKAKKKKVKKHKKDVKAAKKKHKKNHPDAHADATKKHKRNHSVARASVNRSAKAAGHAQGVVKTADGKGKGQLHKGVAKLRASRRALRKHNHSLSVRLSRQARGHFRAAVKAAGGKPTADFDETSDETEVVESEPTEDDGAVLIQEEEKAMPSEDVILTDPTVGDLSEDLSSDAETTE